MNKTIDINNKVFIQISTEPSYYEWKYYGKQYDYYFRVMKEIFKINIFKKTLSYNWELGYYFVNYKDNLNINEYAKIAYELSQKKCRRGNIDILINFK